jgi:hypothetical protein
VREERVAGSCQGPGVSPSSPGRDLGDFGQDRGDVPARTTGRLARRAAAPSTSTCTSSSYYCHVVRALNGQDVPGRGGAACSDRATSGACGNELPKYGTACERVARARAPAVWCPMVRCVQSAINYQSLPMMERRSRGKQPRSVRTLDQHNAMAR